MSQHNWSGWPGAFCLKCGREDPTERAVALNEMDPYTGEWISEEAKERCIKANVCAVEVKSDN